MSRQYTRRAALAVTAGAVAAATAGPLLPSTETAHGPVVLSGETMGTTYRVTIPTVPAGIGLDIIDRELRQVLERIDTAMSTFRSDSEVSGFNRAPADEWFPVSPETSRVAAAALTMARMTGGAYDPTIGPLVDLWGFGPAGPAVRLPDAAGIAAAQSKIGYGAFEARQAPSALRKRRGGLTVDFSGIAEGFAVDEMVNVLDRLGVRDLLVELGGELRCRGRSPTRQPWTIAVETPGLASAQSPWHVAMPDAAIATSGDYRKFFIIDGRRYGHVIDPGTGRPFDHSLASVTVIGDTAMQCDALATALLVMGLEVGLAFAERRQIAAMFMVRDDRGLTDRITAPFAGHLRREST